MTKLRKVTGKTIAGKCPIPGFDDVLWGDDIEWDETPPPGEELSATALRDIAASVSPAMLQRIGADWRAVAEARRDAGMPPDWNAIFGTGEAPGTDRAIAAATGSKIGTVHAQRFRKGIPCNRVPMDQIARQIRTSEQRSASARKGHATRTPEQRIEVGRRIAASMTPEQRSARQRRIAAVMTQDQKSEKARKIWARRRANDKDRNEPK